MRFYSLILSLVCILVFILQILVPGLTEIFLLNKSSLIEPLRFVSAIFLHSSLQHLVFNLFALIFFGLILEKIIGSKNFLFVFFVSGISANLVSFNFYSASLGSSGAIFGIIGSLTVLRPKMVVWAFSLPMPLFVASILWMLGDVFGLFIPSNIGHMAHLSGFFLGIFFGLIFRVKYGQEKKESGKKIKIPEAYMKEWEDKYILRQ